MIDKSTAQANFEKLKGNSYPGRGILVGMNEEGNNLVQIYWIMGRSENSRNRIFLEGKNGVLKTEPANPEKVTDPSLIIYTAMAEAKRQEDGGQDGKIFWSLYAVSNGHQTTDALREGDIEKSLADWQYEPDAPNFTPRITAVSYIGENKKEIGFSNVISILKKMPENAECFRSFYSFVPEAGFGHCVTTYRGDGNPLPSFEGAPYPLPLRGGIHTIAETFWNALNEDNRVSLAVKFIDIETEKSTIRIINKN